MTFSDGPQLSVDTINLLLNALLNQPPVTGDCSLTTPEDQALTLHASDFLFSDSNGQPMAGLQIISLPADGQLLLGEMAVKAGQFITRAQLDSGELCWLPPLDDFGNALTSLTFAVSDGALQSATAPSR